MITQKKAISLTPSALSVFNLSNKTNFAKY